MLHREMLVWMIGGIRLVGAPTVGPDLCGVKHLATGAQYDTEGFVFEH
jgi:hypothetical protein